MTNSEAINVINQVRDVITKNPSWMEEATRVVNEAFNMAIKALEAQEWTPCSEKPPDEIDNYLVTLDFKERGTGITTLWFHGLLGWDFPVADVVTAWMPLPEPYKAERENKHEQ